MANPRDHVENHLTPFTPSPTKLTDSFGKFADKGLEKGGAFDVVVKKAGDGIGWLADELGTPTGREHFLTFIKDSAIAAVLIEGVIKSAPFAALLAMGGSALALGGMAGFGLGAFLNDPGKALGGSGWDAFNRLFDNGPQLGAAPEGSPWNHELPIMHVVRGRFLAINLPLCTKVKWLFRLTTPSGSVWPVRSSPRWVASLCRQIQLGKPAPPNGCAFTHDLGLTKEQAAGSVGNLSVESDYFRKFHENRQPWQRGGIGDVQWTGKRRLAYERWATENGADPSKLETMKQFTAIELQQMGVLAKLSSAKTRQESANYGGDTMRGRQTEVHIWREDWSKLTLPQASLPGTTAAAITITTVATTIATVTGCTLFMWR